MASYMDCATDPSPLYTVMPECDASVECSADEEVLSIRRDCSCCQIIEAFESLMIDSDCIRLQIIDSSSRISDDDLTRLTADLPGRRIHLYVPSFRLEENAVELPWEDRRSEAFTKPASFVGGWVSIEENSIVSRDSRILHRLNRIGISGVRTGHSCQRADENRICKKRFMGRKDRGEVRPFETTQIILPSILFVQRRIPLSPQAA